MPGPPGLMRLLSYSTKRVTDLETLAFLKWVFFITKVTFLQIPFAASLRISNDFLKFGSRIEVIKNLTKFALSLEVNIPSVHNIYLVSAKQPEPFS